MVVMARLVAAQVGNREPHQREPRLGRIVAVRRHNGRR